MAQKLIRCPNCSFEGPVKRIVKGSAIVEFGLWFLLIIPALFFSMWVFALGLIYTVWRASSQYDGCPACGWRHVVKISKPGGDIVAKEQDYYF